MTAESFMTAVEQKWVFRSLLCTLCQLICFYATYRLHRGEVERGEERRATAMEGGETSRKRESCRVKYMWEKR